jgi:RNA polymerase sigma-70 factor (sigma-E family)
MDRGRDSFDEFVAANADGLLRTAYVIVWDEREAEDLVQETFLQLARRWRRVAAMQQPRAYARRVLVNLAIGEKPEHARRRAELTNAGPDLAALRHELEIDISTLETYAEREELLGALRQLPARQRAVLVLRYLLDLSEAQIAEALGCSAGTVKSTAARGLTSLRELLEQNTADLRGEAS